MSIPLIERPPRREKELCSAPARSTKHSLGPVLTSKLPVEPRPYHSFPSEKARLSALSVIFHQREYFRFFHVFSKLEPAIIFGIPTVRPKSSSHALGPLPPVIANYFESTFCKPLISRLFTAFHLNTKKSSVRTPDTFVLSWLQSAPSPSHNVSHIARTIISRRKSTQPIPNQRQTAKHPSSRTLTRKPDSHNNPNLGRTGAPPVPAGASPAELHDSRATAAPRQVGIWHLVFGISLGLPS
jgi:hypothetical protein